MTRAERWLLPDGVDEVLPPHAVPLEMLRREILDLFAAWGYELVSPPLVEFLESLRAGNGQDLDLQTFKLTDQVSGRLMGLRADITPQVARIDAHRLPTELPQRLCYVGSVLHTRPDNFAGSRNPLQIGAELYGHSGIESDAEIVCLMAEVLSRAQIDTVTIELGHMGVFTALADVAELNLDARSKLLDGLLRKAEADVIDCLEENRVAGGARDHIIALLHLDGGIEIVETANAQLAGAPKAVRNALDALAALVSILSQRIPAVSLHIDLAELRGYRYHTGVTFAAYQPREGRGIAWGGRYDNIGIEFGRQRAATGFSTDLKHLLGLREVAVVARERIFAPAGNEPALQEAIRRLRSDGFTVIQELPGQTGDALALSCYARLQRQNASWQVVRIDNEKP